jgi:glycosyltransferase involved in cell wall biosynthesis
MVILQALACGVPVICSRIEGNTAVLGEDDPGLFDLGNEAGYTEKVCAFFTDSGYRNALVEHQRLVQAAQPSFMDFLKRLDVVYQQAKEG